MVAPPPDLETRLTRRRLLRAGVSGGLLVPARVGTASPRPERSRAAAPVPPPRVVPPIGALPMVVIDPGHGGKDPGAIGVSGTYEKDIALATAQELRGQLLVTGRFRVALTRTQDVFIPLEERVAYAQGQGAALFVSMHADALADRSVHGASVYTLSTDASDAQTAALARRENSADRFGGASFRDQPPEVAAILASLVRQETRAGSAAMAHSVVGAFHAGVGLLPNPSRHAAFVVLQAADIPSVLVEMGFMSNPADEAALRRSYHRARVAAAMKRAVETYFAAAGPTVRVAG